MAEKTEKPTQKKVKDSAQKGQSFKSKDLVTTAVILMGMGYLVKFSDLYLFTELYQWVILENTHISLSEFWVRVVEVFFRTALPFISVCVVTGMLVTLLQTRFVIATKALKLNFKALNPIEGFKKIFSLRTVKELIKSVMYLGVFVVSFYLIVSDNVRAILTYWRADISTLITLWQKLIFETVVVFIACSVIVLLVDYLAEYFIFFKELKMDKHEVKQERKESDGNPEIKGARRQAHREILTGEEQAAIRNSEVILANPTHIAIGIYFNPEMAMLPFVALRCSNAKARAAIAYAESIGVPVVRYIPLARSIYYRYEQYNFLSLNDDALMKVMEILIWLRQVEHSGMLPDKASDESE